MKVVVLVLCFVGLVFSKVIITDDIEGSGLGKLQYRLLDYAKPTDHSYEVRVYEPSEWVITFVKAHTAEEAKLVGLKRLYDYTSGANDRGIELNMTAPVTTEIRAGHCVYCAANFSVSFQIQSNYQVDPPLPSNENVVIRTRPGVTVYVRNFGGDAFPDSYKMEAYRLWQDMQRNGVVRNQLVTKTMMVAEYNNPTEAWQRHNEIWLIEVELDLYNYHDYYEGVFYWN